MYPLNESRRRRRIDAAADDLSAPFPYYASKPRSYRELPFRNCPSWRNSFRYEKSGELTGL